MPKTNTEAGLSSSQLIKYIEKKIGAASNQQLAAIFDTSPAVVSSWRNSATRLTPLRVANIILKSQAAAKADVHENAIRAIVEFFPIYSVAVGRLEKQQAVFTTGEGAGKQLNGLKKELVAAKSGLYIFYDSRGKALYAGQTQKQNIWKEMNLAFNRDRSAQVLTLVKHPERNVDFRPANSKVRQPTDTTLRLYDLAAYFSAYEVIPEMVDNLEALLVRAFPNDLLNYRMEKFTKAVRKSKILES
jgi:hypothetical protein